MDIGKEREKITSEPIVDPVPKKEPAQPVEPIPTPEPRKEPVKQ